jgi:hypothetical protein
MSRKAIAPEALLDLRRQLGTLPPRSTERRRLIQETAAFYGVSEPTVVYPNSAANSMSLKTR